MKHKDNIVLIGMPGSGKSTAGVVLAKILGMRFLDCDLLIQEETGKLLHELISEHGNDGFLAIEDRINASIDVHNAVISPGGSVVYGRSAMQHLSEIGTIVYLKLSFELLQNRLSNLTERGVVLREGQTLLDLYEERTILYEKYADITIDEAGLSVEDTIAKIIRALR
jgi:shikimate kinase